MSEEEILINIKEMINICDSLPSEECTAHIITHDHFNAVKGLLDLYNKQKEEIERLKNAEEYAKLGKETLLDTIHNQKRIMKSQEKIIMEQEKEIDNYKKQEFGNLFNGRYISKDKIRDKIKELEEKEKNCNFTGLITECEIKIETLKELLEE